MAASWRVIAASIAVGALAWHPQPVAAQVQDRNATVVVDAGDVKLAPSDGGGTSGELTLLNLGSQAVPISAAAEDDGGCSVTPDPAALQPGTRTSVTLTLSTGCNPADGVDLVLDLGGGADPAMVTVAATLVEPDAPDWDPLKLAALISLLAVLVPIAVVVAQIRRLNKKGNEPDQVKARVREAVRAHRRRQEAREAAGLPPAGKEPETKDDKPPKIGITTALSSLGTDWSFKEAWVSNVTLGATALIALLGATDVLEAVLGEKPEEAIAVMAVAAALAATLVGIGPLLLKAVGKDASVPTVGGTVLAGIVVLFGSLLQIFTVSLQAQQLTDQLSLKVLSLGLAIVAAFVVILYGAVSLADLVRRGTAPSATAVSPEVEAAWIVAKAIRPEWKRPVLSPQEVEDLLSTDEDLTDEDIAASLVSLPVQSRRMVGRTALL